MTVSVPMSDDENVEFLSIQSEAERKVFMENLFHTHRAVIEQMMREKMTNEPNDHLVSE